MTFFSVKVSDPDFSEKITDARSFKNINELIQKIAEVLQIDSSQFSIENPPNAQQLKSLPENYEVNIKIDKRISDIKVNLPFGPCIVIPNGYKMKFDKIIKKIRHKKFYFSQLFAKNNLKILLKGNKCEKDVTTKKYPFFAINDNEKIELKAYGDFARFKYNEKMAEFYFSSDDTVKEACKFILESFKKEKIIKPIENVNSITIYKDKVALKDNDKFEKNCDNSYKISIEYKFQLKCKSDKKYKTVQKIDFLSTVDYLKKIIKAIYSDDHGLKKKDITIFDQNDQKVNNTTRLLKDIQNDEGVIYFDFLKKEQKISEKDDQKEVKKVENPVPSSTPIKKRKIIRPRLKSLGNSTNKIVPFANPPEPSEKAGSSNNQISIQFIFDQKSSQSGIPFKYDANLNDTIEDLSKMIRKRFDIKDKIHLQYKFRGMNVTIDKKKNVDDVKKEIIEIKDDSKRNVIYILVKPKDKKTSKKSFRPKITANVTSQNEFDLAPVKEDFSFEFNDQKKELNLNKKLSLENNLDEIKKAFNIDEDTSIKFKIFKKDNQIEVEQFDPRNDPIDRFRECNIKIITEPSTKSKKPSRSDTTNDTNNTAAAADDDDVDSSNDGKSKFKFQTNLNDEVLKIRMPAGSTVKDFKNYIAGLYKTDNLANIKVIFAGKDLLDSLVLDDLEIGDIVLYVYVRSMEDILLMTAKALKIKKEDIEKYDDDEEEELY